MTEYDNALFQWFCKATGISDITIDNLADPKYWLVLAKDIPSFEVVEYVKPNEKTPLWRTNYINFKSIYQTVEKYYKKELKSLLPTGLPFINLTQLSKGQNKQGLIHLLILFFLMCINSREQEKYIKGILQMKDYEQIQLMNLIQLKSLVSISEQEEQMEDPLMKERKKIEQLEQKLAYLQIENDSLNQQLNSTQQQKVKVKQQLKKLDMDNKKLKRQLDEKLLYIQQKQQQQEQQQSSNRFLSVSNEQVISTLRKQLVDQERDHLEEKKTMQYAIEQLSQQLQHARNKVIELQSQDLMGTVSRKVQHQDCVSVNEHKNITQKLQLKVKNLENRQTELEREALRAKYDYEELTRKFKRQEKQKQNLKVQYEKQISQKGQSISINDAQKIKLEVLLAVKNKLKIRIEESKHSIQQSQ